MNPVNPVNRVNCSESGDELQTPQTVSTKRPFVSQVCILLQQNAHFYQNDASYFNRMHSLPLGSPILSSHAHLGDLLPISFQSRPNIFQISSQSRSNLVPNWPRAHWPMGQGPGRRGPRSLAAPRALAHGPMGPGPLRDEIGTRLGRDLENIWARLERDWHDIS